MYKLTPTQIAWRVAQDLPQGSTVYLGMGLPLLVPAFTGSDPTKNSGRSSSSFFSSTKPLPNGMQADCVVLEAAQVSEHGDLALRSFPDVAAEELLALAATARQVFVLMDFFDSNYRATLVPVCSDALVQKHCVTSAYTDLTVFDFKDDKVLLRELVEGITLYTLQAELEFDFQVAPHLRLLVAPK